MIHVFKTKTWDTSINNGFYRRTDAIQKFSDVKIYSRIYVLVNYFVHVRYCKKFLKNIKLKYYKNHAEQKKRFFILSIDYTKIISILVNFEMHKFKFVQKKNYLY